MAEEWFELWLVEKDVDQQILKQNGFTSNLFFENLNLDSQESTILIFTYFVETYLLQGLI